MAHRKNKVERSDWDIHPMPPEHKVISCSQSFSPQEYHQLQKGFFPKVMEDKWFIYFEDDKLYCHRSWTGYCYYIVEFEVHDKYHQISKVVVNRNPKQCSETDDGWDMEFVVYLIHLILLHKPAQYPQRKGVDSITSAGHQWGHVGRAMLGDVDI